MYMLLQMIFEASMNARINSQCPDEPDKQNHVRGDRRGVGTKKGRGTLGEAGRGVQRDEGEVGGEVW